MNDNYNYNKGKEAQNNTGFISFHIRKIATQSPPTNKHLLVPSKRMGNSCTRELELHLDAKQITILIIK